MPNMTARETIKRAQKNSLVNVGDFSSESAAHAAVNEMHTQTVVIPALLAAESMASDATDLLLMRTVRKIKIVAVRIIPRAALTAHDTNYATVRLNSDDDAGGADTVLAGADTTTTGTGNWTAQRSVALTVVTTAAIVDAGKALHFVTVKAGSGVAVPVCFVEIDYEYV